jgi:hypothetical protein
MDSAKLNDWLQVIGLFGVIASLVFVGMQMKQDREIALSDAYQARTATAIDFQASVVSSPELLDAQLRVQENGFENVSARDRILYTTYVRMGLNIYENVYFQYMNGFIDDEHWSRTQNQIRQFLLSPPNRVAIRQDIDAGLWRESFGEYLVNQLDELGSE